MLRTPLSKAAAMNLIIKIDSKHYLDIPSNSKQHNCNIYSADVKVE